MKLSAKQSSLLALSMMLFAILACKHGKSSEGSASSIPDDKKSYVGDWRASLPNGSFRLNIASDGTVNYERKEGSGNRSISGGKISKFIGDDFEVKLLLLSSTFKVTTPPHQDGRLWKMTVDGVEVSHQDTSEPQSETGELTLQTAEMRKDDGNGQSSDQSTETFSQAENIHCYIDWEKPKSGTKIKFVYIAVDAGTLKNETIKEVNLVTVNDTDNLANSSLTSKKPFPKGQYKVDIYINDKLARTVQFEIA
jgi:hypothetical protein